MKKLLIATVFLGLFSVIILGGCAKEHDNKAEEKVEVVMYGGVKKIRQNTKAQIVPQGGLPSEQLTVGIVTVNYRTDDPVNDQPNLAAWRGSTADNTRGYFGGPGLNAQSVTNGEIEYTNDDGTAVQKVFYEETGEYYFVRVYYPFEDSEFMQTSDGASIIFHDMDGSKDILCSNLGWGNIDQPVMTSNEADGVLVFSHMLSLFRISVVAENEKAVEQYGEILEIMLYEQPGKAIIDMQSRTIRPYSTERTFYDTVGFPDDPMTLTTEEEGKQEAGYVMAIPGRKFLLGAKTSGRLYLEAFLDFATIDDLYKTSEPGKIYDVTLKFMESYQVLLEVEEPKEWWMDSEFD